MGGGRQETADLGTMPEAMSLAKALRASFATRPRDAWFFRAETLAQFADLLDRRRDDPDFWGDPYALYGGRSLHGRSHGEAFLEVLQRLDTGVFLLDEPEAALSPQRQLALLALLRERVSGGKSQFVVATHSPVLMTFPGAAIVSFDHVPPRRVSLEETSHYQITRGVLQDPDRWWRHLGREDGASAEGKAPSAGSSSGDPAQAHHDTK
jgi:predicted ATPase